MFIDIVYTEESTGECAGLAEGDEQGGMDLALGVNEDATEEENEASDGEHKGCYELEIYFHGKINFLARWHDLFSKFFANIYQKRGGLQIFRLSLN